MDRLNINDLTDFIERNIDTFHRKRLNRLEKLKLRQILRRKNPYLFKAKNILTAQDLVKTLLDAHLSSQEETIFGDFLEELAIFINQKVFGGWKSSAEGIDLEFDKDGKRYIVSIKSGPNWGNSSQIQRLRDNFRRAARILRTSNSNLQIVAVNGCCYGREPHPDKGDYLKLCGQDFWYFISGDSNLYLDIIKPLGHKAKEKNEEFLENYSQILNKFTFEFGDKFCENGKINWNKLIQFNSGKNPPDV